MSMPPPPGGWPTSAPQPDKKRKKGLTGGLAVLSIGLVVIGSLLYVNLSGTPTKIGSPFDRGAEAIGVALVAEDEHLFQAAIKAAETLTGCKPTAGARQEVDPNDPAAVTKEADERGRYVAAAQEAGYRTGHAVIPSTDGQVMHQVVVYDC